MDISNTACSAGQYRVIPGARPDFFDISNLQSAEGVIDIKLNISQNSYKYDIQRAVISKAREVMAHEFNFPNTTCLTIYADHVLFSIENCYPTCRSWNAFTATGSYSLVSTG
jgi:hypothetical protein